MLYMLYVFQFVKDYENWFGYGKLYEKKSTVNHNNQSLNPLQINQSINQKHFYSAICRERIRGVIDDTTKQNI